MADKDYFKRALPLKSLYKIAFKVRRNIFNIFMDNINPEPYEKIVDIGVFAGSTDPNQNYLEHLYPHSGQITAVGIDDASFLQQQYPGLKFVKVIAHTRLPFEDNQFDIGFSSATIEHAGSMEDQKFFMEEAIRVSKRLFLTSPNRYFPLEFHTLLPFLHWLPQRIFRRILKDIKLEFYSKEENLNLLGKNELLSLVPTQYKAKARLLSYRLLGVTSNLILILNKENI